MNVMAFQTLVLLAFPVAVLATWQAVEIWHHASLFSAARARIEQWENFPGRLLLCPFCLSPWMALLVCLIVGLGVVLCAVGSPVCGLLLQLPAYALAVSRAANLANDLAHRFTRTPRFDKLPDIREDETADDKPPEESEI